MATLFRDGSIWKLRAIGTGIALKTPTDSIESLLSSPLLPSPLLPFV